MTSITEIKKTIQSCLPQPEFRNISDGFMVTAFAAQKAVRVTDRVIDNRTENQQRIIKLITENKRVSTAQMADNISISKRKVPDNISKLKKMGLIRRIGTPKAGHWKIINK